MFYNCVLAPAAYDQMEEKYKDIPCNHCINKQYGCPEKQAIQVGYERFIPIENDAKELPICKIWCRKCKGKTGEIQHEVLWNRRNAYAIKCPICNSEFLLYRDKVKYEYTGYTDFNGEFVPADPYHTRQIRQIGHFFERRNNEPETVLVASFGENSDDNSAMAVALKKAGII